MLLSEVVTASSEVRATRSRLRKREVLAGALRELEGDEIPIGVSYLSGELPQGRIGLGYASVYGAEAEPASVPSLRLADVDRILTTISDTVGAGSQAKRRELLEELLRRATTAEQEFLRTLVLRELRQGALETSMSEAVASVVGVDASAVQRAVMLSGDLSQVAIAALSNGPEGLARFRLTLFRPVRPMLADTAADVAEALERHGPASIEAKLDGARIQAHKDMDAVALYTRNLRDVTRQLPEIVDIVGELDADSLILDGEVIALDDEGRPRPFQVTMSRFGRRQDIEATRNTTPLTPFFFDCLLADDEDLIDETEERRWGALARVVPNVYLPPRVVTGDAGEAEDFYRSILEAGHEGVIVKSLEASYRAGRRGSAWLKVKPAHTLDLVVLAAEWGSGRRRGWLSNIHLGARDPDHGGYVMLGKTFKGLTDEMLEWQTSRFLELETHREGHVVHVRPEQVVEIAFDGLQASPRYPGGLALRFARVKGYRDDKGPGEADTIATVREVFAGRRPGRR